MIGFLAAFAGGLAGSLVGWLAASRLRSGPGEAVKPLPAPLIVPTIYDAMDQVKRDVPGAFSYPTTEHRITVEVPNDDPLDEAEIAQRNFQEAEFARQERERRKAVRRQMFENAERPVGL